jgi:hypothetical protein
VLVESLPFSWKGLLQYSVPDNQFQHIKKVITNYKRGITVLGRCRIWNERALSKRCSRRDGENHEKKNETI